MRPQKIYHHTEFRQSAMYCKLHLFFIITLPISYLLEHKTYPTRYLSLSRVPCQGGDANIAIHFPHINWSCSEKRLKQQVYKMLSPSYLPTYLQIEGKSIENLHDSVLLGPHIGGWLYVRTKFTRLAKWVQQLGPHDCSWKCIST